jgi:hypothetical protein
VGSTAEAACLDGEREHSSKGGKVAVHSCWRGTFFQSCLCVGPGSRCGDVNRAKHAEMATGDWRPHLAEPLLEQSLCVSLALAAAALAYFLATMVVGHPPRAAVLTSEHSSHARPPAAGCSSTCSRPSPNSSGISSGIAWSRDSDGRRCRGGGSGGHVATKWTSPRFACSSPRACRSGRSLVV